MYVKTFACFALTAASLTVVAITSASAYEGSSWSARRNVVESQRYDRLLETNLAFRKARMRKECGPITDPQLRQDCLASFGQDEPYVGSSSPRRHYPSSAGR